MKILKYFCFSALVLSFCFLTACGGESSGNETNTSPEPTTQPAPQPAADRSGPEYSAHFVCPKHCKGSGSEEEGNCPVCGAQYVHNDEFAH